MSHAPRIKDRPASLPFEMWPTADQAIVEAAFAPGDVFDRGSLAHLRQSSQKAHKWAYGAWISYVAAAHPERVAMAPADRADRATLVAFARDHAVRGSTRHTIATQLRSVATILSAAGDTSIGSRIRGLAALGAVRSEKASEIVTSDRLVDLGLRLMQAALDGLDAGKRRWPEDYRDGLIIALLAATPLRRANFAALRIGTGLLVGVERILVCTHPEYTKSKTAGEWEVPPGLDAWLRLYLDEVRPLLTGARESDYLWPSGRSEHLQDDRIYKIISRATKAAFGFAVPPHDFRDAAATTIAIEAPERIALARDLLGHADLKTTHKHYIRSRGIATSQRVEQIINNARSDQN